MAALCNPPTDYRVSPSLSELLQLLLEGVDVLLEPVSFGQYVNHVLLVVSGCLFRRLLLSMVQYLVCLLLCVCACLIWLLAVGHLGKVYAHCLVGCVLFIILYWEHEF